MRILSEHRREHLLSSVDARIKIIASMLLLIMVLSYKGILFPLLVFLSAVTLCYKIRIPLRVFLMRFSEPFFVISVVMLLKVFFFGKVILFSFKVLHVAITAHSDGLAEGAAIACRIMGAVSVVALLGFSTPFNELMGGLSWMRVPKVFVEIVMFAYRYIFMFFEDALVIYNAQKNRLGYSNLRRSLGSFGVLAGSLTLKAFEHSESMTVAMVQRGYDGNMPVLKHRPFKTSEVVASLFIVLVMGIVWKI